MASPAPQIISKFEIILPLQKLIESLDDISGFWKTIHLNCFIRTLDALKVKDILAVSISEGLELLRFKLKSVILQF